MNTRQPMLQRRIHLSRTLRYLQRSSLTSAQLAQLLGVSRTASGQILDQLDREGWVRAVSNPADGQTIGRPPKVYTFRADRGVVAGLDVGAHACRAIVADLTGVPLGQAFRPVDPLLPTPDRIAALIGCLDDAFGSTGFSRDDLWAVGAGTTGVVRDGSVVHYGGEGMPQWAGTALAREIGEHIGCPVSLDGDSALGAYGELWRGAARGTDSALYILAGHRIGAGLVIGKQLVRGAHGGVGLIGELPALEWSRLEPFLRQHPDALSDHDLNEVFDYLATGIAGMVLTVDPEIVVIGGGLMRRAPHALYELRARLQPRVVTMPTLREGLLAEWAVAHGALRLALDNADATYLEPAPAGMVPLAPRP